MVFNLKAFEFLKYFIYFNLLEQKVNTIYITMMQTFFWYNYCDRNLFVIFKVKNLLKHNEIYRQIVMLGV